MKYDAVFSPCGRYRYLLERAFDPVFGVAPERKDGLLVHPGDRTLTWVMLNPSKADARADDATLRRIIDFTVRENYARLLVVNLYAIIETESFKLARKDDPVGPEADRYIVKAAKEADRVVFAWGAHPLAPARAPVVEALIRSLDTPPPIVCLGLTKEGAPCHPLRLRADTPFTAWRQS